jgi:hypothetical protein
MRRSRNGRVFIYEVAAKAIADREFSAARSGKSAGMSSTESPTSRLATIVPASPFDLGRVHLDHLGVSKKMALKDAIFHVHLTK